MVSRGVALGRGAALTTVAGNTAGLATELLVVVAGLGGMLADSASTVLFTAACSRVTWPLGRPRRTLQLASLGAICVLVALVSDGLWALA